MKVLIVRMWPYEMNINSYNCQEIGLAKEIVNKGNICDLVLYTKSQPREEDYLFENKKIHIYYLKAKNLLKNCVYEKKIYKVAQNYDVVQSAEYDQIGNYFLKKHCKKFVIYHGPYSSNFTKGYNIKCVFSDIFYFFHKSFKNTRMITKSKLAEEFLYKKGFKNVSTIGVGLDIERISQKNENESKELKELFETKKNLNLKYLLYIGKIEDRRNITFLVQLMNELKNIDDSIRLIIVGKGSKKYLKSVKKMISALEIEKYINWYDEISQSQISYLYEQCEAFLLPTKYEIFGMVLLEAMFMGIPVITTFNGGASTLIKDSYNGFICKENDIENWKSKVEIVLYNNKKSNEIKKNAKKTIEEDYTWLSLSEKFLKVYNE